MLDADEVEKTASADRTSPCSVSSTRRQVIEKKLLAALDDEGTVAILANEEMLNDLIRALWNYEGDLDRRLRLESIRADLTQLRDAAFPRNAGSDARRA